METLETLGKRIETTEDLQSIVGTMKALAAVSIRQYEEAVAALNDYSRTIDLGLQAILLRRAFLPSTGEAEAGPVAVVIWGSDHGLCGRFNEEVTTFSKRELKEFGEAGRETLRIAVGRRAWARLRALGESADVFYPGPSGVGSLSETAQDILLQLDEWQRKRGVGAAQIFHNRRTETKISQPVRVRLLPIGSAALTDLRRKAWPTRALPVYRMALDRLFSDLVRQRLFIEVFRAGAESLASEQASRLASMQGAERNIRERLEEMLGLFRRKRQEAITNELLDVVSGFESTRTENKPL